MSSALTREELDLVRNLQAVGVPANSATLAVVMVTREHARPEIELIDIVRQYPYLESRLEAQTAVADLKARGWLMQTESYGRSLTHQAAGLKHLLANAIGDAALVDRLSALRASLDPTIQIVGPMNDARVYTTYLDLLQEARSEIILPMLATTPELLSVPVLQERARRGVQIRILLGAPSVVATLRGQVSGGRAPEVIRRWREHFHGLSGVEIRLVHDPADIQIATCMLIDRRLLRFDVYDAWQQRSLEGVMLEVAAPAGSNLNLIDLFLRHFEEVWGRASPVDCGGWLIYALRRGWQSYLGLMFALVAIVTRSWGYEVAFAISASLAAGFFFSAIVAFGIPIPVRWRRHRI